MTQKTLGLHSVSITLQQLTLLLFSGFSDLIDLVFFVFFTGLYAALLSMSHQRVIFRGKKNPTSVKQMIPAWHQMSTTVYHLLAICISTANKLTSITINFMFRRLLKETKTSHSSSKASKCRIEDPESSIRHLDSESINGESLQQKKPKKKKP